MKTNEFDSMCFYITPIGSEKSDERDKMEALKENIISPVLETFGLKLVVAHTIDESGSITDQIFERIVHSKLVIVDITGLNPNVMYELAVRHSFGKPCVVICNNNTRLPFDLLSERTIFFSDSIKGAGELKSELNKKIKSALEDNSDNPVLRAVRKSSILDNPDVVPSDKEILQVLYRVNDRLAEMELRHIVGDDSFFHRNNKSSSSNVKKIRMKDIMLDVTDVYYALKNDLGRIPSLQEIQAEVDLPNELIKEVLMSTGIH